MWWDCVIIGGGAVGLAAACHLGREAAANNTKKTVLVLEKAPRVGKKLLATGNGTCNITNVNATAENYHGDRRLAAQLLEAVPPSQTLEFFRSLGVLCTVRPDGKAYPRSAQAASVLDALRLELAACGVETRCDCAVSAIKPHKGGFALSLPEGETLMARQVLVCVGGAAAPSLGGSAEGYRLLTDLGCEKTPLFPSIVQLRTATDFVRAVKGIRVDAAVSLWLDDKRIAADEGEVLFTDYGLSGPAVMAISRAAADWERRKQGNMTVRLHLMPDWDVEQLTEEIQRRRSLKGRTLEDVLTGLLHKRVGQTVLRVAGVTPLTRAVDTLTDAECARVAATIAAWEIPVTGTQGFGGAQVTAGGIAPSDFDPATLMHRRYVGLYAAGEVLDVDGDCGGYNLQFAWSGAAVAARAMIARW